MRGGAGGKRKETKIASSNKERVIITSDNINVLRVTIFFTETSFIGGGFDGGDENVTF